MVILMADDRTNRTFGSQAVTRGVRVHVESRYAPEHSQPHQNQWFFHYTVEITNDGPDTVQVVSRHWIITDATGKVEEIRGLGIVGKQPVLLPGRSFRYTSGCSIATPYGTMRGTYQTVSANGDNFDLEIAPFTLSEPYTVH
jgi:ApaG protein